MIDIDDVVQAPARLVPKPGAERLPSRVVNSIPLTVELPADFEGREPQRLDFDRLADSGGDDPVANFGIHPRQLLAGYAGSQQAVAITADAVTSSAKVAGENGLNGRADFLVKFAGAGGPSAWLRSRKSPTATMYHSDASTELYSAAPA